MPFKIAKDGALAPPTLFPSPEAAIAAGRDAWDGAEFKVQEVRQAVLGDFFSLQGIMGDIRETMQEKCGRTDVVDDPEFIGNSNMLGYCVEQALNYFQDQTNLVLDGYLIVERTIHVRSEEDNQA